MNQFSIPSIRLKMLQLLLIVPIIFMGTISMVLSADSGSSEFLRGKVIDPRDGQVYNTTQIGGLEWFAQNLNYAFPGSYCYNDDTKNCKKYGRLYRWEDALAACPTGWHLSTDFEWQKLEMALGMSFDELETINDRGTNQGSQLAKGGKTGFEYDLPGFRDPAGIYIQLEEGMALWHANEADYGTAWHRDLRPIRTGVWRSRVNKEYALSVRCVKNTFNSDHDSWDH